MAVRAAAGTGYLTKAPSGFSAAPWTVIGWQRAQLSGGIGHNAISLVNAGITTYNYLYVGTDGAVSAGTDGGDGATSTGEIPTDTWVPVVLTRTGSTVTARRVDSRASATYGSAGTNTVASIWALGSQPDESRRDMRGLKVWSALLSADEIAAEIQQFEPVRTANLVHYAPLAEHTDLADAIAGGSWTNNGASLSTVDDPANVAEEWEGPKVAASNTTNATSSSGGLSINLPSGIVAGNLLLAFAANDTSVSWSATGTWAQIDNGANGTAVQGACWARIATADANDNLTITGEANDIAVVTLRVVDHGVSNVSTDIVLGTAATGSDGAPDAPNCNPGTSGKYLWLTYFASDDDDDTTYWWPVEAAPISQTKSATGTSSCMVGVAYRWLEASSYNPTAFAMSASEEWRAQTFAIPAAASGSTYDDTLTESVTAGQSFTNTAVFVSSVSESATVGDSYAVALTLPTVFSESVTLGDAFAGGAVQSATIAEAVALGESAAVAATFAASLAESATLADAYTSVAVMPAAFTESVTLADVYAPALTINVTLVDSATLGDGVTTGTIYNDTLGEAISAADAYAAVLTISATVSESVTAADAYASVAVMAAALTEAFTPADAFGVGAIFPAALGESTTLGDIYPDSHSQSETDVLTDSVTVADDYAAQAAFAASLVESASFGDAFTAELVIPVALAESVSLADAYASARLVTADLDESVAMADAVASVLQAITTLAEDVTLDGSMLGTVAGTLTVDLPHTRRVGPRVMSFGVTRIGERRMSFGSARIGPRRMQFGVRRIGPRTIKGD